MPWRTYTCYFCSGYKQIEVGTEINEKFVQVEPCPACEGKGFMHVTHNPYLPNSENFIRRMMGDGGLI
jgi:DnaJ-class molecular chaperone